MHGTKVRTCLIYLDQQRINTQTDRNGQVWHFDPRQEHAGWTRTVRELDVQAMTASTVANLQTGLIQLGYYRSISQPLQSSGMNDVTTLCSLRSDVERFRPHNQHG